METEGSIRRQEGWNFSSLFRRIGRDQRDETHPVVPAVPKDGDQQLSGSEEPLDGKGPIHEIRPGVDWNHLETILRWVEDPRVRGHLDPLPDLPDWNNRLDVSRAKWKLYDYYRDNRVLPMTALDESGRPIGVLTIRWRGDRFAPPDQRIATIERLIVDPNLHRRGIGTELMARAIDYAFDEYKGYRGERGAREVRAWVMTDPEAGDFHKNINFMHKFGFSLLTDERAAWSRYAKELGIETNREAYWYKLEGDAWEETKITFPSRKSAPSNLSQSQNA